MQWWRELSLEQKVGVASLPFIVLTFFAAALIVPEVRCALQLELETPEKCKPAGIQISPSPMPKPPTDLKNPESNGQSTAKPTLRVVPLPNAAPLQEPTGPLMTLRPKVKPETRERVMPRGPVMFGMGRSVLAGSKGNGDLLISPDDAAKYLILRVEPTYPPVARDAGIQGKVILRIRIAKDGTVEAVQTESGNPMLAKAAQDAVRQWRYTPFKRDGHLVAAETTTTLDFGIK